MTKIIAVALVCMLIIPSVFAEQVPGTSVNLTPPDGFIAADRFPGFMQESTGSSIMVLEIPGPYDEVTAGLSDDERMKAQGMTVLSRSSVKVDGHAAILMHIEQSAYGTLFEKWMVAADRSGTTAMITATYPKTEAKQQDALKAAILSATFGISTDPTDALNFTATPITPFKVAKVIGQTMILTPNGQFPAEDEAIPLMILGLSASEDLAIQNQKAFAERRVTKVATVKNITVDHSSPITIGKLSGYTTTASGFGEDAATPLTIYQVILFDSSGYCLIQGISPFAKKSTYVPIFAEIAKTFKMKDRTTKPSKATE